MPDPRSSPLVLGIDPGTATTGYGVVTERDGGLVALDYGVITTPAGQPDAERLLTIHTTLTALIARHQPNAAAVEKLFFQKNVSTAMTVSQARGVILLALAQAGLHPGEYTPNEVKQAVVGYGSADKPQMQQMVRLLLGLADIPRPDDAADALAIAIAHLHTTQVQRLT